jgi:hypothetical protein
MVTGEKACRTRVAIQCVFSATSPHKSAVSRQASPSKKEIFRRVVSKQRGGFFLPGKALAELSKKTRLAK